MRRYLLCALCALCLLPALLALELPVGGAPPADEAPFPFSAQDKVDINSALPAELALLPGIGEARAAAIAEDRAANGPFANVRELARVKGVSDGLAARVAPYVTAENDCLK